jgi:hypothetical protein
MGRLLRLFSEEANSELPPGEYFLTVKVSGTTYFLTVKVDGDTYKLVVKV